MEITLPKYTVKNGDNFVTLPELKTDILPVHIPLDNYEIRSTCNQ